jgi:hypothetical protein
MRGNRILWLAALAAVVALSAPAAAQANEVTKWNEIAQNRLGAAAHQLCSACVGHVHGDGAGRRV